MSDPQNKPISLTQEQCFLEFSKSTKHFSLFNIFQHDIADDQNRCTVAGFDIGEGCASTRRDRWVASAWPLGFRPGQADTTSALNLLVKHVSVRISNAMRCDAWNLYEYVQILFKSVLCFGASGVSSEVRTLQDKQLNKMGRDGKAQFQVARVVTGAGVSICSPTGLQLPPTDCCTVIPISVYLQQAQVSVSVTSWKDHAEPFHCFQTPEVSLYTKCSSV